MEVEHKFINTSGNNTRRPYFTRQLFVCFTTWSYFYVCGLSLGSPTVVIPQLRKLANSPSAVSSEMASWIASIIGYSGTCFVLILILMSHLFGRKKCLFLLSINSIGASTLLYCSYNAVHILICQAMFGMIVAAQMSILMMIMTEYTSAEYRGLFLTLKSATNFWGIWTANAIGIFADYKYIGILAILCSIFNFTATFFIPESPYWLAFKGRYEECTKSHRWLKGVQESAEMELNVLVTTQKESRKNEVKKTLLGCIRKCLVNIKEPSIYRPVILTFLLFTYYHLSGKMVYAVYAVEMMKKITTDESTAHIGVLVLDGFSVLGMYIGCGLSKILNRRTILLVSSTVATIFLFLISLCLYLIQLSLLSENIYITLTLLVVYSLAICCGPMIMSTTICGELLPIRCRSLCVCLFALFCSIVLGVTVKVSPYMFTAFGFHGTFLFFAIGSSVSLFLIYIYVPETKDKTLHAIAEIFKEKENETEEAIQISLLHDNSSKRNI